VRHLPKALLLALLVGGCGVDYQKCAAIQDALVRSNARINVALDEKVNNYFQKFCGANPGNATDRYLLYTYLVCKEEVLEKYEGKIAKAPDVVVATNQRNEIVKDLKWNRCK